MATPTNLPASFVSGEILTAANMNLLRGGFRILQVVQDNTVSPTITTSGSYIDTDLSLSITPQFTSSKILAVVSLMNYSSASGTEAAYNIVRGSTQIAEIVGLGLNQVGGASVVSGSIIYLDSPATVSATTYKVQMKRAAGSGTLYMSPGGSLSSLTLLEISA